MVRLFTICVLFISSLILFCNTTFASVNEKEDIKFRTEFGFDIPSKPLSVKNESSLNKYGVNLTPEEEEEIDSRIEFETKSIPKILEALKKANLFDEKIVGTYINQQKGGVFTILIKDNTLIGNIITLEDLIRNTINPVFRVDEKIDVKVVDYSEEELNYYQDLLFELEEELKSKGIEIYSSATNLFEGVIEIGVLNYTSDAENVIKQVIGYNKIKVFQANEFVNFNRLAQHRPLFGGIGILRSGDPNSYTCSTSYPARNTGGQYFIVTAAHCSNTSVGWSQGGGYIGHMSINHHQNSGQVDAGAIYIGTSSNLAVSRVYNPAPMYQKVDTLEAWPNEQIGQTTCKSGVTTGSTCGTLQTNRLAYGSWRNLRGATTTADHGDSGGTVFRGQVLTGTLSGGGTINGVNYNMIYSHARNALEDLALIPVFNY